ncbi:glycosyltransferase family 39 protein [Afipia sp. GAS231]|uniref:glycosyltransferase family 39 protein n=1 Tax=Afipia sp. GAS231 TaxID=1882747 RepID=UPI000B8530F1|nr:glycosyltransferase family 39 protein [Afipia sp. GAS231]
MAARSDLAPARWRQPFLKWFDGIERGWAIPLLLVGFVALWWAFLSIAYLGADLHPDVLETWTLGRTFEWGNPKHPPLMGWVARAWTSIFPLTDWSLQLMSMVNAAVALWCVDLISRRFVTGDKRIIVLLLLMLLPTYQFHAQRFNANSVLLAIWPLATYCFLRSFESRHLVWAAAAGATAAIAMLGKYYSIFLVGSFVFAAICHPQRRAYFGSGAPLVSVVAGLVVLGPHLHWLATTGAAPFDYALAHAGFGFGQALDEALFFVLGLAATLAIPAATWVMIAGYRLERFPQDYRTINDGLRLLFLVAVGTLVFPIVTAVALGTDMPSLWAHQGLFLLAVLIVCGTSYRIERFYTVNLAVMMTGIALIAVIVAAPIHAIYRNIHGYEEGRSFYRLAAEELTREWHEQTNMPLAAVSGDDALAFATAFYSPDHPVYARPFAYQYTWGLPRQTTLKRGWAALCFEGDAPCIEWMQKTSARATEFLNAQFVVQSRLLGTPGTSRRVIALIVPPARTDPITPPIGPSNEDLSARKRIQSSPEN